VDVVVIKLKWCHSLVLKRETIKCMMTKVGITETMSSLIYAVLR
jgi:hypothetical protein